MPSIVIRLDVDGDGGEALALVNRILDWGSLQNEINDNGEIPLKVTSATATLYDSPPCQQFDKRTRKRVRK